MRKVWWIPEVGAKVFRREETYYRSTFEMGGVVWGSFAVRYVSWARCLVSLVASCSRSARARVAVAVGYFAVAKLGVTQFARLDHWSLSGKLL